MASLRWACLGRVEGGTPGCEPPPLHDGRSTPHAPVASGAHTPERHCRSPRLRPSAPTAQGERSLETGRLNSDKVRLCVAISRPEGDGILTPRAQGARVTVPYVLPSEPPEGDIKTCEPFSAGGGAVSDPALPVAQSRLQASPPLGSRLEACAG